MRVLVSLVLLACVLSGCSGADATGPGEVRWDRETCTRCGMAIGDRYASAQVRGGPAGQHTRLYLFDDIGCAVIWLAGQPWADDPRTEIWVTDHRDGRWIDARQASYITGIRTSMGYGLGAQQEPAVGGMDFASAREYIQALEQREHIHGGGGRRHPAGGDGVQP
jgi:copper chaperone NosL